MRTRTLIFNKPFGVLSCFTDPEGRATLADYISIPDVYPAGRLDLDSEGLLLLTSDGRLAHQITDPRHNLPKKYLVQVERVPDDAILERLRKGVVVQGRKTHEAIVTLLEEAPCLWPRSVPIRFRKSVPTAWIEMTIRQGLNRQIRRMTAAVGYPTLRIIRMAIGPVLLGNLEPGQWRELHPDEIVALRTSLVEANS